MRKDPVNNFHRKLNFALAQLAEVTQMIEANEKAGRHPFASVHLVRQKRNLEGEVAWTKKKLSEKRRGRSRGRRRAA